MPLLRLETTAILPEDKRKNLLVALSRAVAGAIGKPEQYVMVTISEADIVMSGQSGEAAFVDIRSIGGLTGQVKHSLSKGVCQLISDSLGIPAERVYLNFNDVDAGNWGWNGTTFG